MQIKDLKSILYSTTGNVQFAVVYDSKTFTDIIDGCSIDYAVKEYGDYELKRIQADGNKLVLTI